MTELRPVSDDARTLPGGYAVVFVPLCCWALAALGAAAGPVMLIGALFVPVVMLPVALLLHVGIGFVNAAILRAATGRRRIGLAIVLTLVVPVGIGAAFVAKGEIPFEPYHGIPVPLVIGAVAAGISTFALPKWAKLVGVLTIVAVVAPYAWQAASDAAQDAAAARTSQAAARQEMYDNLVPGATTTLTGAETDLRTLSADSAEVAVDLDGRELTITMSGWGDPNKEDPDGFACWMLTGEESWIAGQTYADFADRCSIVDGGWAGSGGLAFGTYRSGHWVTVVAGPAATAEDVAAVAKTLADVPEAERRDHWEAANDLPPERG